MYFSTRSCWRFATSGPISVAASAGSPTVEAADHRRQRVDDLVVALAAGEDARLRNARLAVVHQRRDLEPLDRGGEVGVVEDDRGRLAAELEAHALELLTADRGDAPARGGRTGERDLVDAGVAHEVLTDFAPGGQDRHDALRDAGLVEQLGHEVRVERRLRRGLQDDRATREQRGRELRHRDELRDVPRHDAGDDADRLAAHDDVGAEHAGAGLFPRVLRGDADERVEHHPRRGRLAEVGERDRRTHLLGDDRRPCRRGVPAYDVGEASAPRRCALRATAAATRRRRTRSRATADRTIDVGGRGFGNPSRSTSSVCGEITSMTSLGRRVDPLATDEQLVVHLHEHIPPEVVATPMVVMTQLPRFGAIAGIVQTHPAGSDFGLGRESKVPAFVRRLPLAGVPHPASCS